MFSLQVRQTRVSTLVFSEVLPCCGLSGCYAFVFQQPIGIGHGVPIFPAHDKRDPWERGCSKAASGNVCACVKLSGKHLLRGKYFMAEECHIQDEVLAC